MKKFTNSTVKTKLVILIAMNTLFLALGGLIVYWQSNKIVNATNSLEKNLEAIVHQGQLRCHSRGCLFRSVAKHGSQHRMAGSENMALWALKKWTK